MIAPLKQEEGDGTALYPNSCVLVLLLGGCAKPQVDRPPTLVLAIDQAEELFAIGEGQEVVLLRQHLALALLACKTACTRALAARPR